MLVALLVFLGTYLIVGVQRLPMLRLDRPSGALLGAVAMVLAGVLRFDQALGAIDLDTILFLLGMMVVLAYLEMSGFFELVERAILAGARSPRGLLLRVVLSSGVLAAAFMNDTICLMLTPVLLRLTARLGLPPAPYLIALCTAANIGSSATVLGNPQNALVAIRSGLTLLPFAGRLWPVALIGLLLDAALLAWIYRREIGRDPLPVPPREPAATSEPWLMATSLLAGAGMVAALVAGVRPAAAAMAAAGGVIAAGAARPRRALGLVDWPLLVFFGGLFVVMRGVEQSGLARLLVAPLAGPLDSPTAGGALVLLRLAAALTVLSQAVSNVPAILLFVPALEQAPAATARDLWLGAAAFSTLAGNLTVIGSAANVIVFETARRAGVEVGFREYLRVGVPITLATLLVAWLLLAFT